MTVQLFLLDIKIACQFRQIGLTGDGQIPIREIQSISLSGLNFVDVPSCISSILG